MTMPNRLHPTVLDLCAGPPFIGADDHAHPPGSAPVVSSGW